MKHSMNDVSMVHQPTEKLREDVGAVVRRRWRRRRHFGLVRGTDDCGARCRPNDGGAGPTRPYNCSGGLRGEIGKDAIGAKLAKGSACGSQNAAEQDLTAGQACQRTIRPSNVAPIYRLEGRIRALRDFTEGRPVSSHQCTDAITGQTKCSSQAPKDREA